jgi:A/G-specific adenine glycosylase
MASGNVTEILHWYGSHQRDLPWRRPDATPWAVLVSEVMLQQTPVARVLPVYEEWLSRWPAPAALAAAPAGDAVRAWGRLGYPRRALRLHATARVLTERHGGEVPASVDALLALPGIGSYTAAAVASFAFGQRQAVLDTNVRRVLARLFNGQERPPVSPSAAEVRLAESLLPESPGVAARWSVAVMELGALVCTAARPACASCPVAQSCAWRRAGSPASRDGRRGAQGYDGTDRQCRGRLLGVLREAAGPVAARRLDAVWPDPLQRARALDSLVADGLIDPLPDGRFALPEHGDPGDGDPGQGDPGQGDPGQQESLAGNSFPARLPRS